MAELTQNTIAINDTHICALQLQEDNRIKVCFIEIDDPLINPAGEILQILTEQSSFPTEIVSKILHCHEFAPLIQNSFNYCQELDQPYQSPSRPLIDLVELIRDESVTPEDKSSLYDEIKEIFLKQLKAYALERAYADCESDRTILAYSHRKRGFRYKTFRLGKDIEIGFQTNFGYGSVSYFYTILTYKGLEVIPFSEWVEYRYSNLAELVKYSARHRPANKDWEDAMEYGKEAYNLAHESEEKFIEKYLIEECEKLVIGLENILIDKKFQFMDQRRIYTRLNVSGSELVCFKGEKISGAIDFISKIDNFCKYLNMQQFIVRIEECNRRLLPILIRELDSLKKIISEYSVKFEDVSRKIEPIRKDKRRLDDLEDIFNCFLDESEYIQYDLEYFGKKFRDDFIDYYESQRRLIGIDITYEEILAQDDDAPKRKFEEYIRKYHRKRWYLRILLNQLDDELQQNFIIYFDKVYSRRFVFSDYNSESFSDFVSDFISTMDIKENDKNKVLSGEEILQIFITLQTYSRNLGKKFFDFSEGFIDNLNTSLDSIMRCTNDENIKSILNKARDLPTEVWNSFTVFLEGKYNNKEYFGFKDLSYSAFVATNELYNKVKSEYDIIESKIRYLENLCATIEKHISKINQYFDGKKAA